MYFLIVRAADGSPLRRNVDRSTLRTGRSSDNDLVLADPCVSRTHFEIVRRADGCFLIDLGSKAGTEVNSVRVTEPVRLRAGDRIRAGRTMLTFETSSTPLPLDPDSPTAGGEITPSREAPAAGKGARSPDGAPPPGRGIDFDRPVEEILERAMDLAGRTKEFQEAAAIQRILLPDLPPEIPGYRLDGSTFPCAEVGGDYYDFVRLPGDRIGIAVADVAGHGLPAALLMSRFQALLSVLWESEPDLDRMVRRLNQLLCRRMPANRYITLFCAILDPGRHSLSYVNAGHPPAWLVAPDGTDIPLAITGLFLGSFPEVAIQQATVPIRPESILVCPSDGVTETRNAGGEMYGEGRLTATVRRHLGEAPGDIIAHLTTEVDSHRAGARQSDDMTLVVLARR